MELSKRLQAVAALIPQGVLLGDVGTDHAYVPVRLVRDGVIGHALALDINAGPLERAAKNIEAVRLSDRIEVRLSDGLKNVMPGEITCACIAGMGGPLTIRILEQSAKVAASCRYLVLQPQSDIRQVRAWLDMHRLPVEQEDIVFEDGKYYPMMRVRVCQESDLAGSSRPDPTRKADDTKELAYRFGPLLLARKHPVLRQYLVREERILTQILRQLSGRENERALQRRQEVTEDLRLVECALHIFDCTEGMTAG